MRARIVWSALAVAALFVACKAVTEFVPPTDEQMRPQPTPENPPADSLGAAERYQLGSIHANPSYPPRHLDGGLITPEGDQVSSAINAERARLEDAGVSDGGIDAGTSVPLSAVDRNLVAPSTATRANPGEGADDINEALVPAGVNAGDVAELVFSAGVSGELVPCGCSPDLRGGLPRAASLLARWRKREPGLVYVEAGDLLFAGDSAPQGPAAAQLKMKARTLAQASALLGAAGRVIGARDLAAGGKFVADTADGIPLLDAGGEVPGARATLLVKAGPSGVPVGIFAAGLGADPEKTIAARAAELQKQGARFVVLLFHPQGDRALSAAQRILSAAHAAGVDLVLLAHRDDPSLDPNHAESSTPPLLALEGHGQSLLRLDVIFPPNAKPGAPVWMPKSEEEKQGDLKLIEQRAELLRQRLSSADAELKPVLQKKIAELESRKAVLAASGDGEPPPGSVIVRARFRPLSQELPDEPAAKALVAAYDKQVADENLEAAKKLPAECPRPKKGEAAFIGVSAAGVNGAKSGEKSESCASCHASEAAFWSRTRHARAYETLVSKGKQFSFDCISCHTTGWQQPGGVCRIDRTGFGGPGLATPSDRTGAGFDDPLPETLASGRQGVQCEACHGPASEHAKTGSEMSLDVPEQSCKRCHDFANSPHFDYAKYRPWVVGPGHGERLAADESPRTRGEILAGNKLGPNPELHAAAK